MSNLANKKLGQNFLKSNKIPSLMVNALEISKGDEVVEIGGGLGAVTKPLAFEVKNKSGSAKILELDERFIPELKNTVKETPVEILNENILTWLPEFTPAGNFKIIGSLPYYITSPIIHTVIKSPVKPLICVFLVQKEVAEKLSALAPKGSYFSNFLQTFYTCEILEIVTKQEFTPVPKVDSAVIKLTLKENLLVANHEILKYEKFLHRGFSKTRKMLNKTFNRDFLTSLEIADTLRPQHLEISEWLKIYRATFPAQ